MGDQAGSSLERAFVAASRAEAEREGERQRRANRRLRVLLTGVGVMLALAVVAGAIAVAQRGQAREAAVVADAQHVGAEAVGREQLDQALLLARAGVGLQDSAATRGNLLSVLARNPAVIGVPQGDGKPLTSVAVSPDGRLGAVGSSRGAVTVFDGRASYVSRSRPTGGRSSPPTTTDACSSGTYRAANSVNS